jgi:hypothetical protein
LQDGHGSETLVVVGTESVPECGDPCVREGSARGGSGEGSVQEIGLAWVQVEPNLGSLCLEESNRVGETVVACAKGDVVKEGQLVATL